MGKVWCYVLDATGVTGLTSFDGSEVGTPLMKHLYECEDDNVDLSQDGTGKLYHAANDKINATDLQNALNVYYGAPVPTHLVQIRYYTTTTDIESAGIVADGGTAEIIKIADGVYDLVSDDPLTFVAIFDATYYAYYYNYYFDVTKIEVISGVSLERFVQWEDGAEFDFPEYTTFGGYINMTDFAWLGASPSNLLSSGAMFISNEGLLRVDISNIDFSKVTDMAYMFFLCAIAQESIINANIDSSSVQRFDYFMANTNLIKSIIESLDTSSAVSMAYMFSEPIATIEENISFLGFDTSNVTNFEGMFTYYSYLGHIDLSSFTANSATSTYGMFVDSSFTSINLSSFDLSSNPCDTSETFRYMPNLICVSNINTTTSTDKTSMLDNCPALLQPDAAAIIDIQDIDGANWVNANPCPAVV